MRHPGDNEPDPPGGRAAERLREFLQQHMVESEAKEQEIKQRIDSAEDLFQVSTDTSKTDTAS
jgi:hypothetical protein